MEDAPQILLGLANVFGDDGAQITRYKSFPRSRASVWAATRAHIRSLPVSRTRTLFRCASLPTGLRFVFAPHFAQMNATTSFKAARNRVDNRSSGSIQFSG